MFECVNVLKVAAISMGFAFVGGESTAKGAERSGGEQKAQKPLRQTWLYLRLYHVVHTSVVRHFCFTSTASMVRRMCSTREMDPWCDARSSVPRRRQRDFILEVLDHGW